ncbi:hypothetical protein TIFTF001_023361 [Ficus carica]|uniref:Uncharacterized protein n=1 Tax=Ficus carica TaxID=3494 RepID=A0AA88AEJ1_FICCA|nr:hypothetical protein TIFTF001_023361 [Ficus carica]
MEIKWLGMLLGLTASTPPPLVKEAGSVGRGSGESRPRFLWILGSGDVVGGGHMDLAHGGRCWHGTIGWGGGHRCRGLEVGGREGLTLGGLGSRRSGTRGLVVRVWARYSWVWGVSSLGFGGEGPRARRRGGAGSCGFVSWGVAWWWFAVARGIGEVCC